MRSYNSIICVFTGIPGRFDTNGFIMGTGSFSLTFYSKLDGITPQQLKNSLQVRSYKSLAVWSKKTKKNFNWWIFKGKRWQTFFCMLNFLPSLKLLYIFSSFEKSWDKNKFHTMTKRIKVKLNFLSQILIKSKRLRRYQIYNWLCKYNVKI